MSDNKETHLETEELDDGSLHVELPEGDEGQEESKNENKHDGFALADGQDDDRSDIRERRREERQAKKAAARERDSANKSLINSLKRQNEELSARLSQVENSARGFQFAQVDKAIDDEKVRIQYAKMKVEEAVANQDGATLNQAQELMFEAKQKLAMLENAKKQAARAAQQQRHVARVDPSVASNAQEWMARNKWYDPSLKDLDSRLTRQIDEALAEEGFDPADPDYWDELDKRLSKHLPHRFGKHVQGNPNRARPSVGGGSARSDATSGGTTGFRLSPERVAAIKAAGKWDNVAERNKMINKYVEYDKRARS